MRTRRAERRDDERGSLAIELAMIAPLLLFLFALIYAYGKVSQVEGLLESGTRDAARTATDSRSYDDAQHRAQVVLEQALDGAPASCRSSAQASVDQQEFSPGSPVTTRGTCQFTLSDAGLPGVNLTIHAHSSFVSVLDPNRGLDTGAVP